MNSIYDRALLEVGQNGIFQKKFDIIHNGIMFMFWIMAYMNIILILVITPHTCQLPERPENISEFLWKLNHIPTYKDVAGEVKFSSCSMYEYVNGTKSNITTVCDEYNFDKTWYESTIPSQNNWVCDKELYVANVFAYSRIGEIFGSIIFGWFGDISGRRIVYVMSLIFIIVGRIISILFSHSFLLFVTGCIISSLPSWSAVQSIAVLSIEISSPERHTTTATIRNAALCIGVSIMPLLYWWLRDWKLFMIVTTVIQVPFVILAGNIIESPRWLWIEGKTKACVKQLKIIAKTNKTTLKTDTEQELLTTKPPKNSKTFGPFALFYGWTLAMNTILQLCLWIIVSLSYTVLIMSSGEKTESNPFLEFSWQSLIELPGNFIAAWLADHIGRRYTSVVSCGVSASLWTLMFFRESNTNVWICNWWMGESLILLNRLSTTVLYYTINLFNMETYPTSLRQSGMSLGNVFSSASSACAPYVLYLGRRIDSRLPGMLLTVISLSGIICSLLLPETLNAKLPETLEDAQTFGRSNRKCFLFSLKRSIPRQENETVVQFINHKIENETIRE